LASAKGEVSPMVAAIVIILVVAVAVVVVLYGLGYLGKKQPPGILPTPGAGGSTETGSLVSPADGIRTAWDGAGPRPCAGRLV
jgi:hypothetical protein